jgi:hypothetical protein
VIDAEGKIASYVPQVDAKTWPAELLSTF